MLKGANCYQIAVGHNRVARYFHSKNNPPKEDAGQHSQVGKVVGFSHHARLAAEAHRREKLDMTVLRSAQKTTFLCLAKIRDTCRARPHSCWD